MEELTYEEILDREIQQLEKKLEYYKSREKNFLKVCKPMSDDAILRKWDPMVQHIMRQSLQLAIAKRLENMWELFACNNDLEWVKDAKPIVMPMIARVYPKGFV